VPSRRRIAEDVALVETGPDDERVPGIHDELEIDIAVDTV
jgi:hypothetical protein